MSGNTINASGGSRAWGWLVALGVCISLVGLVALSSMAVTSLVSVIFFGSLLLVAGGFQFALSVWGRGWEGFWIHVLLGLLYLIVGAMIIGKPILAEETLTWMIAFYLLATGVMRVVAGFTTPVGFSGWLVLNGLINILLGASIWQQWPYSGLWVIGLFIGVDLLFSGASLIALGLAVRRLGKAAA